MKNLHGFNLFFMAVIFSICSIVTVNASAVGMERLLPALASNEIGPLHKKVKTIEPTETRKLAIKKTYGKLPLYFIENKGQVDGQVSFYERGTGHATFFTEDGVVLSLSKRDSKTDKSSFNKDILGLETKESAKTTSEAVSLSFVGANKKAKITANDKKSGKVNYFIGNDKTKWRTGIPTYGAVTYKDVYKNIDVKFYGNNKNMEHDVIVRPGGDFSKVKFAYHGIKGLKVTDTGDLEVTLNHGKLIEQKPVIYQEIKGERVTVDGSYRISNGNTYGFNVASYDKTKNLVIDPVLVYSTYLGGADNDHGYDIAVDSTGAAYVTGYTWSTDFPLMNPKQGTCGGVSFCSDAFITKINSAGTALVYSTFLGGDGVEFGSSIAVDNTGAAYVTGRTRSTDFPLMNPIQATYRGDGIWYGDAFITKINPVGSAIIYSTYLGGTNDEGGNGIAVDSTGAAYIIGHTWSTDFPLMNPVQGVFGGREDVFITKLNSVGSAFVYSTYLGGQSDDSGSGIAVDGTGAVYVTGSTSSTNFPLMNPIQGVIRVFSDAFITKVNSTGSAFVYSTYLGGNSDDSGSDIAVDSTGAAYIRGHTWSTDFPLMNPVQGAFGGGSDAFITKINPTGSAYVYSTYLGGSNDEQGNGIAVDNFGAAYIAGRTSSVDFPLVNPLQWAYGGGFFDAFITKLNPAGSAYVYSTYLGGSDWDGGWGIAVDSTGAAYITGDTASTDFPVVSPLQAVTGGLNDAFITKIGITVSLLVTPDAASLARGSILGYNVTATNTTAVQQCFSYWENVTLPNNTTYPPSGELFGPVNVCLASGASKTAHLTHGVPMSAPVGAYIFNAFVGTNPTPVTSEAHFNFDVTAFNPATQNPQTSWRLLENGFRK